MPYIKSDRRELRYVDVVHVGTSIEGSGELNFVLTEVVLGYLREYGLSYQTCNDIIGALDNCKDEFRRRVQHPYEDEKRAENGDVYP